MANTHTTLASLFTDIADAIREKTGETGTIVADNFPTAIGAINAGEGEYIWKKYEPGKTTTVSFAITSKSPVKLKVSCTDVDLTKVTSSFFVGMKGTYKHNTTNYTYEFTSASAVTMNTSSNSFTYDPATYTISINVNNSFLVSWSSATTETGLTFLDYVVSKDSTAYPNGAEQDGYWYEKVNEGGIPVKGEGNFTLTTGLSPSWKYDKVIIDAKDKIILRNYSDLGGNTTITVEYVNANKNALIHGGLIEHALCSGGLYTTNYEVIADTIMAYAMYSSSSYSFQKDSKIKFKTRQLGVECVYIYNTSSENNTKIWISNDCTTIYSSSNQRGFFHQSYSSLPKIYCEATSKPSDWGTYWNHYYYSGANGPATTTWGVTEAQFDAL